MMGRETRPRLRPTQQIKTCGQERCCIWVGGQGGDPGGRPASNERGQALQPACTGCPPRLHFRGVSLEVRPGEERARSTNSFTHRKLQQAFRRSGMLGRRQRMDRILLARPSRRPRRCRGRGQAVAENALRPSSRFFRTTRRRPHRRRAHRDRFRSSGRRCSKLSRMSTWRPAPPALRKSRRAGSFPFKGWERSAARRNCLQDNWPALSRRPAAQR